MTPRPPQPEYTVADFLFANPQNFAIPQLAGAIVRALRAAGWRITREEN